jgi:hypothetical protein
MAHERERSLPAGSAPASQRCIARQCQVCGWIASARRARRRRVPASGLTLGSEGRRPIHGGIPRHRVGRKPDEIRTLGFGHRQSIRHQTTDNAIACITRACSSTRASSVSPDRGLRTAQPIIARNKALTVMSSTIRRNRPCGDDVADRHFRPALPRSRARPRFSGQCGRFAAWCDAMGPVMGLFMVGQGAVTSTSPG